MRRRLPSLHLLHIFEAAGRHLSFKLAAEELHITPSAVSHQVKALEQQLGFTLFRRGNRKIELTEGGRAYLGVVARCFAGLRQGTDRARRDYGSAALHINMITALGRHIVIPRLDSLQERLPGVSLRIETSEKLADFDTQEVDVAVRYGMGDWPGLTSEKLLDLVSTPVCSPGYATAQGIRRIEDLRAKRLIHMAFFPQAWPLWARVAGLGEIDADKALWFDNYEACIQAAQQGLGLALALLPLEQALVDSGDLVTPVEERVEMPQKLFLVCRPQDVERKDIGIFRDWLREQLQPPATGDGTG